MFGPYVAATAAQPFDLACANCALWVAGAVDWSIGFDPAADLRGRGFRWFDWLQEIKRAGGLVNLITPRMVHPALRPLDGDGVAVACVAGRQMCGLVMGGRLVLRGQAGLVVADEFTILKGWSWSPH